MNKQKFLGIAFLILAILALTFSIICFSLGTSGFESEKSYGGDAYTGIQNAAAHTSRNVAWLTENVNQISGMMFLFVFAVCFVFGIFNFLSLQKATPKPVAVHRPAKVSSEEQKNKFSSEELIQ